jgi:hypothetical protein
VIEVEAGQTADLVGRGLARVDHTHHALHERVRVLGEDLDVELGLALEVAVDRTLREPGAACDLVEVRALEALLEEDLARGVDDALAAALAPLAAGLQIGSLPSYCRCSKSAVER